MKKLLSCLLVIAMLATMIPAVALSTFALTDIPADAQTVKVNDKDFTVIRSKDDLMNQIDENKYLKNNLIFANDIDMKETVVNEKLFKMNGNKTIDGNGYSIFNFSLTGTADTSLFDVDWNCTVEFRNLNFGKPGQHIQVSGNYNNNARIGVLLSYSNAFISFENVNVYANIENEDTSNHPIGIFAATVKNNYTFRNCNAYGSIKTSSGSSWTSIGGLVGEAYDPAVLRFENCSNNATITTGSENAGGFVGKCTNSQEVTLKNCANYGEITGSWNSGCFVGKLCPATSGTPVFEFDGCTNYGKMTGNSGEVAGIIGHLNAASNNNTGFKLTLRNCTNLGEIKANGGDNASGIISRIQATATNSASDIDIINCINYGNVIGKGRTAGIVATFEGTSGSKNTIDMTGCKNYGSINGTGGDSGAMFAYFGFVSDELTVSNCANFGGLSGAGTGGGVCGSVGMNNGSPSVKISYFLNMGNISANGKVAGVLANVWRDAAATIEMDHCVNLGTLQGGDTTGGIVSDNQNSIRMTVNNCLSVGTVSTTKGALGCIIGNKAGTVTGENNSYMVSGNANPNTDFATNVVADWNAVLEVLNRDYATTFGSFILNDTQNGVVFAAPKFVGMQESAVKNGTFNVRLIATIDTVNYTNVGFNITVNGSEKVKTLKCKSVFMKLTGNNDGKMISYTATELGGSYIYALVLEGLSADEAYSFTVTPFATDADGETVYTGVAYTVRYVNGVYTTAD